MAMAVPLLFFSLFNSSLHSLVFISLSFLLYHTFGLEKPLCHDDDCSSLLQFKQSFVFDNFSCHPSTYSKLNSWKFGNDCCLWDGVECDDETGHVIRLDLSSSCLYSSINSSNPLFRLVYLTYLDLSSNNFNLSRIPDGIRSLSQLRHLDLSFSNFSGQIPSKILDHSKLVFLDLSLNEHLMGYLPEFSVGSPLKTLRLSGTSISGQLPQSIENLKSLDTFTANGCRFKGVIPASIGNLSQLKVLDLSSNYFSGNIPSSFRNLFQLTNLSLSYNNFNPSTLHWLAKLTNLHHLGLKKSNSYGPFPSSFQNLTQLFELWLDSNQLTGQIPSWLGNSTHLTKLFLSNNQLQGPVPDSIFRLPNIQAVDLRSNNLSGTLRCDSFLQSKYLSYLQLSMNHLSIVSNTYINVTLPQFQILGLRRCNLIEFPDFLHKQHDIKALVLSHNNIKGYIPSWIFNLESLIFLDFSYNFLTGFEHSLSVLPWTSLSGLSLSFNKLEGPLPIPPPSISLYDVSRNKFSGEISQLFCNLTFLLALDLSSNNLNGNLPSCFSNLESSALVLNLRNNCLSGEIPDNFTSGCALKQMDFSQNNIGGEVPRSLANCSNLEILNLEENWMNDVFPSWLGILPNLRILSLRSNKLYGAIGQPISKFEFNRLQIIDLSDNNFSGKLPVKYFKIWNAMKRVDGDHLAYMEVITNFYFGDFPWTFRNLYFIKIVNKGMERAYNHIVDFFVVVDLSSNNFEGKIPKIIGTLRALQSLNLSNNVLTGSIPSSFRNLMKLEALDLSFNNLSGEIPIQLASLTFLAFFNVSHNILTGPIPRGNQFDTFNNDSFLVNSGLCGDQLSKKCGNTKALPLPLSEDEDVDSPFEIYWETVLIGLGIGLAIGVAFGCAMDTRKYEWLVKKKKFARRLKRQEN